jgi:hypothetical protein
VAVAYTQIDVGGTVTRQTTSYFTDEISINEYGTKELLWSPGAASAEHANAAGTAQLYQSRYPAPLITPAPDASKSFAEITCRGWWDTLDWRYYSNAGTANMDTANQVGTIIVSKGQFFENLYLEVTSGISMSQMRDGDNTALYFATQMMETGTTNYRRMLAEVDPWRNVRLYEEPARPIMPHRLFADGSFEDPFGTPIRKELCPVGFWAQRVDVSSSSADSFLLGDPSLLFVEGMEYDVGKEKLTHRARGDPDPWEFPVIRYG